MAVFSATTLACSPRPVGSASSSVPVRPGVADMSIPVPEVPTKGLPVPASASPNARTAARSPSTAPA
jgi:hypothetical protein